MGDTDTTEENALLMLNPRLMPKLPPRLMLMPLPGIIVDTMDTPTDTDTTVWDTVHTMVDTTDIPTDTDTVTGDKELLRIRTHTMVTIGGNLSRSSNFQPPFGLSTNQQLLPSKILKYFLTNIFIGTKEFFCFFEKGSVQSNIIHTALRL